MDDESRRFRKNYEIGRQGYRQGNVQRRDDNVIQFPERYTAKKGTAYRAKQKRKNKRVRLKIASLILAAGIGLGGLTIARNLNNEPQISVTQLQQLGINESELNLENDTLQTMKTYDEYFENFNPSTISLSDDDVITMINDIQALNFNVIKDKMAELRGVERDDIKLYYNFDKNDGSYYTAVKIHEGEYGKEEVYNNNYGLFGSENTIPKEVSELIVQTGKYEDIVNDLKSDHITKANAIKELEKLYRKISNLATKDFKLDDKGNIELEDYTETREQDKTSERDENER